MAIRSSIVAALGTKAVVGGAVAALATGTAVAAVHATGSADPVNWGQHVVQVVEGCKDVRPSPSANGSRGIGECVSDVANTHGQKERAQHSEKSEPTPGASGSPLPGNREGQESPKPGNANGGTAADHGHGTAPSPAGNGNAGQHSSGGHGQPTPKP